MTNSLRVSSRAAPFNANVRVLQSGAYALCRRTNSLLCGGEGRGGRRRTAARVLPRWPAHARPDPRPYLPRAERFGHVVIRSRTKAGQQIGLFSPAGKHHHVGVAEPTPDAGYMNTRGG